MKYHEHIKEVYKNIAPYIKKTPVLCSSYFSQQNENDLFFKCENLQYTHAFKVRGAFNKSFCVCTIGCYLWENS